MAPKDKTEDVFTFNEVSYIMAVLDSKGLTLGNKHFDVMAVLDGNRSASSFQHKFRGVKVRGKELSSEFADGAGTPSAQKSSKKSTPASKKRGKSANIANGDGEDDDETTPSKKPKTVKEPKSKATKIKKEVVEEASEESDGDANGLSTSYFDDAMASAE